MDGATVHVDNFAATEKAFDATNLETEDRREWRTGRIGGLFDLVGGYAFKSGDFIDTGIPVIKECQG